MKPLLFAMVLCLVLPEVSAMAQTSSSPTPDQVAIVEGNNAFAVGLYGQLRKQNGNLFFSPESISTAFAMAYAGASGQTASEMASALHFTLPPDRLHPAMGALLDSLNAAHNGYQLRVADALWAQQDESLLAGFLEITKTDYDAGLHRVDFRTSSEAARLIINQWVEDKTENKIKDLFKPGSLDPSTRLALTNAIYFKGDWQAQFDKAYTKDEDFHSSGTETVKAPLMHLSAKFSYFNGGTFQLLDIPYKTGDLSMVVILPNDAGGLPALEQSLTSAGVQQWMAGLKPGSRVILTLPKFTMTQKFELEDALSAMGMPSAFQRGAADFSGMNGKRDLWIGVAIHKAYIDVNEEGTEAAAATGIGIRTMAVMREEPPVVFRADHPFLFLIRDNRSGGILFMGRVTDPAK